MKLRSKFCLFTLTGVVLIGATGCSRRAEQKSAETPSQTSSAQTQMPPAPNPSVTPSPAPQKPETPPPVSTAQTDQAPAPAQTSAPKPVTQAKAPAPTPPPPPPKPKTFQVPAGSRINVRTVTAMSTKTLKTGDPFQVSLSVPLVVHGVVIAPRGADAAGIVVNSDPGGRVKGVASLALQIQAIRSADGQTIRVHTNSFVQQAKSTKKRDAIRTGIGAGVGAAIGAIAGGGKGAAIGAGVGGGAGVATNLATRGAPAELPAESVLEFTLADPAVITEIRPGSLAHKRSTTPSSPAVSGEPMPVPPSQ